jgi:hypothetical protein
MGTQESGTDAVRADAGARAGSGGGKIEKVFFLHAVFEEMVHVRMVMENEIIVGGGVRMYRPFWASLYIQIRRVVGDAAWKA